MIIKSKRNIFILFIILIIVFCSCAINQKDEPKNVLVLFGDEWDFFLDLTNSSVWDLKDEMIETFTNISLNNMLDSSLEYYMEYDANRIFLHFDWTYYREQGYTDVYLNAFADPINKDIDNIDYRVLTDPLDMLDIIANYETNIDYLVMLFHGSPDSMAEYNDYNEEDSEFYNVSKYIKRTDIEDFINDNGLLNDKFSDDAIIVNCSCKIAQGHLNDDNTIAEMLSYACGRPVIASASMVGLSAFDAATQIAWGYFVEITPDMVHDMAEVNTSIKDNDTYSAALFRKMQSALTEHQGAYNGIASSSCSTDFYNVSVNGETFESISVSATDFSGNSEYTYALPFNRISIECKKSIDSIVPDINITDWGLDDYFEEKEEDIIISLSTSEALEYVKAVSNLF